MSIVNGSFETGTLSPWTTGSNTATVVTSAGTILPYSGNYMASIPTPTVVANNGYISQNGIATVVGISYQLSFFVNTNSLLVNLFNLTVNGVVTTITGILTQNTWKQVTYTFTANTTNTTIRIYNTLTILGAALYADNFTLTSLAPCFDGKSLILTKNILTGVIENIPVENIIDKNYQVFSSAKNDFVPLLMNIKAGPVTRYKVIPKNTIGPNIPFEDLLITGGHKIVVDGKEIKAANIKGAKNIMLDNPTMVYTLCTNDKEPILTNGAQVMSWDLEGWNLYCSTYGVEWENIIKQ